MTAASSETPRLLVTYSERNDENSLIGKANKELCEHLKTEVIVSLILDYVSSLHMGYKKGETISAKQLFVFPPTLSPAAFSPRKEHLLLKDDKGQECGGFFPSSLMTIMVPGITAESYLSVVDHHVFHQQEKEIVLSKLAVMPNTQIHTVIEDQKTDFPEGIDYFRVRKGEILIKSYPNLLIASFSQISPNFLQNAQSLSTCNYDGIIFAESLSENRVVIVWPYCVSVWNKGTQEEETHTKMATKLLDAFVISNQFLAVQSEYNFHFFSLPDCQPIETMNPCGVRMSVGSESFTIFNQKECTIYSSTNLSRIASFQSNIPLNHFSQRGTSLIGPYGNGIIEIKL